MGGETQKVIASENPYYQLGAVPQIFGQAVQDYQPKNRSEMWQRSLAASLSGLLGAGLQAYGNRYQNTLTDRYLNAANIAAKGEIPSQEGLTPTLFGSAQRQGQLGNIFNTLQARQYLEADKVRQDKQEADKQNRLLEFWKSNPDRAEALGITPDAIFGAQAKPQTATPAAPTPSAAAALPVAVDAVGEGVSAEEPELDWVGNLRTQFTPLMDQVEAEALKARRAGTPPATAEQAALKKFGPKIKMEEIRAKELQAKADKAKANIEVANKIDNALATGVYTGPLGETNAKVNRLWGALTDNEEAKAKGTAGNELGALKSSFMSTFRVVGAGSSSDLESKAYMASGAGLDKMSGFNEEFAARTRQVAERDLDYIEFMNTMMAEGMPIAQADTLWIRYTRDVPLWEKVGKKYTRIENPMNFREYFAKKGATQAGAAPPIASSPSQARGAETREQFIARRKAEIMAGQ